MTLPSYLLISKDKVRLLSVYLIRDHKGVK